MPDFLKYLRYVVIFLICIFGSVSISHAKNKLQPTIDFEAKVGNSRDLGTTRFMVPLLQDNNGMLFGDVRVTRDSLGNDEYNAGLGIRQVLRTNDHPFILGGYGFFDYRRSDNDVNHQQITFGAEILTEQWDLRANVYQPITDEEIIGSAGSGTPSTINLVDQQLIFTPGAGGGQIIETPLQGFDLEIGRKLPFYAPISLFGAYYYFDDSLAERIEGYRVRGEWEFNDYLMLTAEHNEDPVRDDTQYVGIRVTVPFQAFQDDETARLTAIGDRMMDPIIRDVDIVTNTSQTGGGQPGDEVVLNSPNGTDARVIYVDNSHSGAEDGSSDNPYTTVEAALTAANPYDTIYIRTGSGAYIPTAGSFDIAQELRVVGAGSALTVNTDFIDAPTGVDLSSFDNQVLIASATAPSIDDDGGAAAFNVTGGDVVELSGMDFATFNSGSGSATVDIGNVSNLNLSNLSFAEISGSGNPNAINILTNTGGIYTANFDDITVSNMTGNARGIFMVADGSGVELNATTSNIDITASNTGTGLYLQSQNDGTLDTSFDNLSIDAASFGIFYGSDNGGETTLDITNSRIANAGDTGILSLTNGGTGFNRLEVSNTTFEGNVIALDANPARFGSDTSTITSTYDLGGGALGSTGGNRFISNTTDIHANLVDDEVIDAQENWWGADADPSTTTGGAPCGSDICLGTGDSVGFSNRLTTDPGP
jgi:hypothetical protein